ncbi:enoyl-CoA hydratase [Verticiella sediminum]|uniref:Enoyl-CoA hydratase n=1 Tax=Verticiella sediminum TaxID=1247510 RepID=A0A556B0C7_9BURK|nr:enoyl-CoA hydratase-related protein [Verticiella sediminum]TSH98610.1 enoyl-CoA hydratase [Verticiella sediminum]
MSDPARPPDDGPPVLLARRDGVATLTLNRPERMNAWSPEMEQAVREHMLALGADPDVRVIVLSATGRAFCAGVDMAALKAAGAGSRVPAALPVSDDDLGQRYSYLLGVPKPVVCGLNGAAAGVGLVISLYCDIRYAAASARLGAVFARRGLIAEHGIAWLLPRLVGLPRATEWLMSARLMDAAEAERIGLVAGILPDQDFHAQLQARARDLAQAVSPRSLAVIKRQLVDATLGQSLAEATTIANAETQRALASEDFREGVAHFVEKRAARFTGR